jgi:chromosome segregation ATPase
MSDTINRCQFFNPLPSEIVGHSVHCRDCGKCESEHDTYAALLSANANLDQARVANADLTNRLADAQETIRLSSTALHTANSNALFWQQQHEQAEVTIADLQRRLADRDEQIALLLP